MTTPVLIPPGDTLCPFLFATQGKYAWQIQPYLLLFNSVSGIGNSPSAPVIVGMVSPLSPILILPHAGCVQSSLQLLKIFKKEQMIIKIVVCANLFKKK